MHEGGVVERPVRPEPEVGPGGWATATVYLCAALDVVWLATIGVLGLYRWLALVTVIAAHVGCVVLQRRRPSVTARTILFLSAGVLALAAVLPVHGSRDVWSYVMTGRILTAHHTSAYTHPPSDFPHDPLYHLVSHTWRGTANAYGPLFNVVAWVGATFYGTSSLLARLWFQFVAAGSVFAGLVVLARRRTAPWVLALIGLAPATLAAVNGAHIDLLVGLGVLLSLVLVRSERLVAAGVVLGLAALVKFNVLPVAFGAGLALVLARRWRSAARLIGSCFGVLLAGYVVAGTAALARVRAESGYTARASIVVGVRTLWEQVFHAAPSVFTDPQLRSLASVVLACAAMAVLAWRHRRTPDPVVFGVGALLIYVLSANYALAWYPTLVLLALGLAGPYLQATGLALLVVFQLSFIAPVKSDEARVPDPFLVSTWSPLIGAVLLVCVALLPTARSTFPARLRERARVLPGLR